MDTPKNAVEAIGNPIHEAMVSCGITPEILAKKLSEELEAEETVFAKFQGKIMDQTDVIAWKVRQEARKDAHRLFGHYPAERHDHSGTVQVAPALSPEDRELMTEFGNKVVNAILSKHRSEIKPGS